jgi:purine-nucleoside phosphorylase
MAEPASTPTPHLAAQHGEIADAVLLPGDPLRAQVVAETFLSDVTCYNRVRNMLGFTGTYRGRRVSVQGTGMGVPSISIYVTELLRFYGVRTAIRIGSCGALHERVKLRDVVIASSAHYTTSMMSRWYPGVGYAPTADFSLLAAAHRIAGERGLSAHVGPILTSDAFYDDDLEVYRSLAAAGTLAVEMEAAALYTIAAREGARALCIATVSDHLVLHEVASTEERQNGFMAMAELALETALAAGPVGT